MPAPNDRCASEFGRSRWMSSGTGKIAGSRSAAQIAELMQGRLDIGFFRNPPSHGFQPKVAFEASDIPTMLGLVSSGLGFSFAQAGLANSAPTGVVFRNLPRFPLAVKTHLVARDAPAVSPIASLFFTIGKEIRRFKASDRSHAKHRRRPAYARRPSPTLTGGQLSTVESLVYTQGKGGDMKKQNVTLERDGTTYAAVYGIVDGLITVTSKEFGRKSVQVAGRPPEELARSLLDEMVADHQRHQRKGWD